MNIDLQRLHIAATSYKKEEYDPLFLLKEKKSIDSEFKEKYSKFYGLNNAGLTDVWREKYFELLGEYKLTGEMNPYEKILKTLYPIVRRKGDCSLQVSFATKLVSFNNEDYPIFDKYVSRYFGIIAPIDDDIDFRIYRFTKNMMNLKKEYEKIGETNEFNSIIEILIKKDNRISKLQKTRIIDILIWTIGKNKKA